MQDELKIYFPTLPTILTSILKTWEPTAKIRMKEFTRISMILKDITQVNGMTVADYSGMLIKKPKKETRREFGKAINRKRSHMRVDLKLSISETII